MPLPQKKRGFRKIIVEGKEFSWRFNSAIEVCPATCKANKLLVDFGWFDVWLHVNDNLNSPPGYDPEVVTPASVKSAIEFALAHNWDIKGRPATTKIKYRDKQFNIVQTGEDARPDDSGRTGIESKFPKL